MSKAGGGFFVAGVAGAGGAGSVTSNEASAISAQAASAINVVSNAVSVVSQAVSALSQQNSVEHAALSVRVDTVSQQASVLSQAVSVISQTVSVHSQRFSTLGGGATSTYLRKTGIGDFAWEWGSVTAGGVGSVTSGQRDVLSQGISVLSVQAALVDGRETQAIWEEVLAGANTSIVLLAGGKAIEVSALPASVTSAELDTVSNAVSVLSQATSVADAALSVRVDTQSQSISVLSQAVSVISQQVSALSQAHSVLSQAVSVASDANSAAHVSLETHASTASAAATSADAHAAAASAAATSVDTRVNTLSQAVSVLSQQVSVLSQRVSAGLGQSAQYRVRGATVQTVSVATLTAIASLSVSVEAGGMYLIQGALMHENGTSGGFAYGISCPALAAGGSYLWMWMTTVAPGQAAAGSVHGYVAFSAVAAVTTAVVSVSVDTVNVLRPVAWQGMFNFSAGGSFQIEARTSVAAALMSVRSGYIRAMRLA